MFSESQFAAISRKLAIEKGYVGRNETIVTSCALSVPVLPS
jgi:hypothetical protein